MTDEELRAMVRDAIARTSARGSTSSPRADLEIARPEPVDGRAHAGFMLFPLPRGGDGDGACLIEPTVRCNHCGYCQSYGH